MSLLLNITRLTLIFLSALGYYFTWYIFMNNGGADMMAQIRDHGPHTLPYTDEAPLKKHYTGIGLVDYQLTVLTLFFYNIIDGSHPNACLQAYQFAGQLVAGWSLLMLESLRYGNRWRLISFVSAWGFMVQNAAFAVVIPIYFMLHLSTSPTVSSRNKSDFIPRFSEHLHISTLPYSIALGLVLPTVAMALPAPSFVSHERKQLFIAIWQAFPIWVGVLQQIIPFLTHYFTDTAVREYSENKSTEYYTFTKMRSVYVLMLTVAIVSRVSTWTISISSVVFPSIFAPGFVDHLSPSAVFRPAGATASLKMPSIAAGALQFLQYDEMVGAAAMCIWSAALYITAMERKSIRGWVSLVMKGIVIEALAGPHGFAVVAVWARDEIIFSYADNAKKKM